MADGPAPLDISFLSTGVVSKALGLPQTAVRAMIESGTLPTPQYMTLGERTERVYSLDWLVLASEQLNLRRLPGMETYSPPPQTVQMALRFDQAAWTIDEVAVRLEAIKDLWSLCANFLMDRSDHSPVPPLHLRRLSAGSPLDLLIWVSQHQGLLGAFGIGSVSSLFMFLLKAPQRVVEAIPRLIVAWKDSLASIDDAEVRRLQSRVKRREFEKKAAALLTQIEATPSGTALSGYDTVNLDLVAPDDVLGIAPSDEKKKLLSSED